MAVATVTSLYGQGVVGQHVTCPWLQPEGPFEITQGYGPTSVQGEPIEDKQGKRQRWHSGVDIGCPTNTHLVFHSSNSGVVARAVYLNNPAGYGFALILEIGIYTPGFRGQGPGGVTLRKADIYLGHLGARLVKDGQLVRDGDVLGLTDSSGNSTGPHLHFEVRPPDGRFGTDLDPSSYFLAGAAAGTGITLPNLDVGSAIQQAEKSLMNTLVGLAQTALGGSMMLAGGLTVGFGIRGLSPGQARRATGSTFRRLNQRRVEARPEPVPGPATEAERSRLRSTLRRTTPAPAGKTAAPKLPGSGKRGPIGLAEERAALRAEMAATGRRAAPGAAIRARARKVA